MRKLALCTVLMVFLAPGAFAADPSLTAANAGAASTVAPAAAPITGEFLTRISASTLFEIESGKLALAKSGTETVRDIATRIMADGTDAAERFKQAIGEARLFTPADALDARHRAILDDLSKKEGAAFDEAWLAAQTKAGERATALLQAYADGGDNARMKQFATARLAVLKQQLEQIAQAKL